MTLRRTILSPVGPLTLAEGEGALVGVAFRDEGACDRSPLLDEAERQLTEYFAGRRREFDLPLAPAGTPFQREVWDALRTIPYGRTCSYGDIARAVGRPKACRAVGMANNRNPLPIVIPCHRVVGASGSLTGYGGGLDIKAMLLKLEGIAIF